MGFVYVCLTSVMQFADVSRVYMCSLAKKCLNQRFYKTLDLSGSRLVSGQMSSGFEAVSCLPHTAVLGHLLFPTIYKKVGNNLVL